MYEDAEPGAAASETKTRLRGPTAKPNGVPPADAYDVRAPAAPLSSTGYTSSRLVPFSDTTSWRPSELKETSAGPAVALERDWVEPAIAASSPSRSIVNPVMLPAPPAFRT